MPQRFRFSSMPSNSTRISHSPTHGWASRIADIGEPSIAADYTRKAYELRDRTSEAEKYFIIGSLP